MLVEDEFESFGTSFFETEELGHENAQPAHYHNHGEENQWNELRHVEFVEVAILAAHAVQR